MTLRIKTVLIVGMTLFCLIAILYITSRVILLSRFARLEEESTIRNVQRATDALKNEISGLNTKLSDWAAWDDTYAFIEDANSGYIESNLNKDTFIKLSLSLVLFIHASGRIVWSRGIDLMKAQEIPVPVSLRKHLSCDSPLVRHTNTTSSRTGIVLLPEGPLLVASQPIVTSDGRGPIKGTMIFGRYLAAGEVKKLSELTHLSLTLSRYDDIPLSEDFKVVRPMLSDRSPLLVRLLDKNTIGGYALIKDIYGKPALILRLESLRAIYKQGQASLLYFISALLVAGIIFGIVVMLLLEKVILSRLARLGDSVRRISESGDLSIPISLAGRDELSQVASSIDGMMTHLQEMAEGNHRMASGDLTVEMMPRSDHDTLGQAFSRMTVNLRSLIRQVAEAAMKVNVASGRLTSAASQIGDATSQIAATIQQVVQGISQQAGSMARTAASVDEMARTIDNVAKGAQEQAFAITQSSHMTTRINTAIRQVTENAQAGAEGSADAARAARTGVEAVQQTAKGMEDIRVQVDLLACKVKEMRDRSQQIGTIAETIDEIASQTDLLALNAAIEAARAGEHGKSFGVVASEVRKLAEKSAAATREVSSLIEGIRGTAGEAVAAMERAAREVEAGMIQAEGAENSLGDILDAAEALARQVQDIAAAARQMSKASDALMSEMVSVSAIVEENTAATQEMAASSVEVTQDIENIASVSEENSAAVQEVSGSAEEISEQADRMAAGAGELAQMAEQLQVLVAQFRLDTGDEDNSWVKNSSPKRAA